jgi:hypothetical protein
MYFNLIDLNGDFNQTNTINLICNQNRGLSSIKTPILTKGILMDRFLSLFRKKKMSSYMCFRVPEVCTKRTSFY